MSKDETASPTPRIIIGAAKTDPNPPWTGVYFSCECGAQYQLGCADECEPASAESCELPNVSAATLQLGELVDATKRDAELWIAPPCWTCGLRNVIRTPIK
jgi:hypothetical protein